MSDIMRSNATKLAQIIAVSFVLIAVLAIGTQAQTLTMQQHAKKICSSFGAYPMFANPSTSELCDRSPTGKGPYNTVWAAVMTNDNYMVVAYFGSNGGSGQPLYVANVPIVANTTNVTCAPTNTNVINCLQLKYGMWANLGSEHAIYTEINGFQGGIAKSP